MFSKFLLSTLFLAAAAPAVFGQGLSSIRTRSDYGSFAPTGFTAGVSMGYDSLSYSDSRAQSFDSAFVQGGVGVNYSSNDERTPWTLGADLGVVNYLSDVGQDTKSTQYSARLTFDFSHSVSERTKIANNFYVTYEIEPNFGLGASTALRNGQYFYGYNNFSISHAWSERFSTVTSLMVDSIQYQDSRIGDFEDRVSYLASQQFVRTLNERTKAVAEYRYRNVAYANGRNDFASHYALVGLDHAWSERTSGTFRAGAELYQGNGNDQANPYFEAAYHRSTSEKTHFTAFTSLGFDGSELGAYGSRYSYRLGVSGSHNMTERLRVNAGVNYAYSTFQDAGAGNTQNSTVLPSQGGDVSEHQLSATAGLGYQLWKNVSVDANYSYTVLASDNNFREYDRNRVSLGVSASF
jgi:hypothetical protein